MQFYASKMVGQFAPDKVGQFRWILQISKSVETSTAK